MKMGKSTKSICLIPALALLSGQMALCQETPSLPRLPRQEPLTESPAPEKEAADTTAVVRPPAVPTDTLRVVPQAASADSAAPGAKRGKSKMAFKTGRIVLDKNGKIFLAATAMLMGTVYLSYRYFRKGVN